MPYDQSGRLIPTPSPAAPMRAPAGGFAQGSPPPPAAPQAPAAPSGPTVGPALWPTTPGYAGTFAGGWGQALPGSKSTGQTANPTPGGGPPAGINGPFTTNKTAQNAWDEHGNSFFGPNAFDDWYTGHSTAFDQPGAAEAANPGIQAALGKGGPFEQYWNAIQGKFSGSAPGVSNNAQTAFDTYSRDRPNLPADAGLGGYYDNAETRATDRLNQEFASRGAYGSSVSQGQIGQTVGDLEAQRAKEEADYQLKAADEKRMWDAGLSTAGRAADVSSLGGAQFGLDWTKTGGQLAQIAEALGLDRTQMGMVANDAADKSRMARLGMGADAAGAAASHDLSGLSAGMTAALGTEGQSSREVQDAFSNIIGPMQTLMGITGSADNSMISGDSGSLSAILDYLTGKTAEGRNEGYRTQQEATADLMAALNYLKSNPTGGGAPAASPSPTA